VSQEKMTNEQQAAAQYYQEYLKMPHEELAKLAMQMRISGEKLEHEYNVLFQTCNTQMKLMGENNKLRML
jgi:hypothetical protein